jgi:hypothetical protein
LDHLQLDRENGFEDWNIGLVEAQSIQVWESLQNINVDEIHRRTISKANRFCVTFLLISNFKLDLIVASIDETQFVKAALKVCRPMFMSILLIE